MFSIRCFQKAFALALPVRPPARCCPSLSADSSTGTHCWSAVCLASAGSSGVLAAESVRLNGRLTAQTEFLSVQTVTVIPNAALSVKDFIFIVYDPTKFLKFRWMFLRLSFHQGAPLKMILSL